MTQAVAAPSVATDASGESPLARCQLFTLIVCALIAAAAFTALGVWQLERRIWKLNLIERVAQRVHAASVPAPPPVAWPTLTAKTAEYRHVNVHGRWLNNLETWVHATTDLGAGFWVVTPLQTDTGYLVLINRGFVPSERATSRQIERREDEVAVTGLLRITEPKGGVLRDNEPGADRWYSRDVAAITITRGLSVTHTAPYFIDADAAADSASSALPIGGLTVISFYNHHLSYAFTWFALAALSTALPLMTICRERR